MDRQTNAKSLHICVKIFKILMNVKEWKTTRQITINNYVVV